MMRGCRASDRSRRHHAERRDLVREGDQVVRLVEAAAGPPAIHAALLRSSGRVRTWCARIALSSDQNARPGAARASSAAVHPVWSSTAAISAVQASHAARIPTRRASHFGPSGGVTVRDHVAAGRTANPRRAADTRGVLLLRRPRPAWTGLNHRPCVGGRPLATAALRAAPGRPRARPGAAARPHPRPAAALGPARRGVGSGRAVRRRRPKRGSPLRRWPGAPWFQPLPWRPAPRRP